jgi:hypothetical protein
MFGPLLLPSCLHIGAVIALIQIPFQGWKNAGGPPVVQTAWTLAFVTCLLVNNVFFDYKYQNRSLIGLTVIVIGLCVSIIGDFEADYLFMELVFAFIYGLCYGFLLPIIQQKIEKISPLDIVFALNFLAFIAISISIPLLSSPAELSAVVATPGFYWKLATLVPVESLYRLAVFYLICHSSVEDYLVTVTAAWIPRTILFAFLYQLDCMISTLKGMFVVLFGCIIYWTSWQSSSTKVKSPADF